MRRAALVLALAACGGEPDPCAELTGACVTVRVDGDGVAALDHLELDVLYGDRHGTATTQASGGRVFELPAVTAIGLELPARAVHVGVVAAGKRSGVVLGTGAGAVTLAAGQRGTITIDLAPPQACVAGGTYCGGDKVAGDPDTLYLCNAGGVPLARGRCTAGCKVSPADDDACRADGGPCTEGGHYCGGDELEGDPQALYTCRSGAGVLERVCPDGCVVNPGADDACR